MSLWKRWDYASVNAGLNAITIFYRRITFVFVLLVLILAVLYPLFLSYDLESTLVMALILVAGLAQSIEYLFCRKYKLLLQADKKLYVVNAINTVGVLIQGIMRIALIFSGRSIVLVQLIPSVVYICRLLLLKLYVERTYSYLDRSVQPDFDVGKGKWSALIHQISSLIVNNTDTVVLSVFIGYSAVSVYSIYNMVMSNLNSFLTQSLSNALTANFGHMLSRNDMKACVDYYEKYEKLYSYIVALIFGVCAVMLIPFVSLYCDDLTNVRYADIGIAALFIVNAVLNNIRIPQLTLISAAGHFKETQSHAILEALINIIVSIVLVHYIGIYGVLIGTTLSFAFRDILYFYYVNKRLLRRKIIKSFYNILRLLGTISIIFVFGSKMEELFPTLYWIQWFFHGVGNALFGILIILAEMLLIDRDSFHIIVHFLHKKGRY